MRPSNVRPLCLSSAADSAKAVKRIKNALHFEVYVWREGQEVLVGSFVDVAHAERFRAQVDGFIRGPNQKAGT